MSIMVSLMLSGVMAATPTTPLPWFQLDDYPMWAVNRRAEGVSSFELLVDPRGKPAACTILQSSGFEPLDRQACNIASKRARFAPALGPDGRPVYGAYRSKVTWSLDPEKWAQLEAGPDIEINLSKLPDDSTQPIDVKFAYLVDSQGKMSDCTAIGPRHPKVLDTLGCEQLTKSAGTPVALRQGTGPVVRTSWVRFAPTQ
jgi:TonB family protein